VILGHAEQGDHLLDCVAASARLVIGSRSGQADYPPTVPT
jgi:hypothetical protein